MQQVFIDLSSFTSDKTLSPQRELEERHLAAQAELEAELQDKAASQEAELRAGFEKQSQQKEKTLLAGHKKELEVSVS